MRARPGREAWRAPAGFTLIEMLVVLTIMALVMTAVPSIMAGLPTIHLRAAADEMVTTLRMLRDQAIRRGTPTELVLDPIGRTYTLTTDTAPHRFPTTVEAVIFQRAAEIPGARLARVRFFPDGSATGGTLLLSHGQQAVPITIYWLSGHVRRP